MSPVTTLLNTRGARGNDAVRQMQTAIQNLQSAPVTDQDACPPGSLGCMFNFNLSEEKVTLPLGWLLSNKSRCEIQNQVGSVSASCSSLRIESDPNAANQRQLQAIIALLVKK